VFRLPKILDAVVAHLGDVYPAPVRRDRYAVRIVELARAAAPLTPRAQERAVGGEILDAEVGQVRYEDDGVGRYGGPGGDLEFPGAAAEASPSTEERTGGGKTLDPVVLTVGYVYVAVGSDGAAARQVELAVALGSPTCRGTNRWA
jgi:hypothetical protein